jgi:hypothetical protein
MSCTVGIVAIIEQGLLLVSFMGVVARVISPRHWLQYKNLKEENCFENIYITRLERAATPL